MEAEAREGGIRKNNSRSKKKKKKKNSRRAHDEAGELRWTGGGGAPTEGNNRSRCINYHEEDDLQCIWSTVVKWHNSKFDFCFFI